MFANSTCFDDDLWGKVARGMAALKEGAIVVTTTDPVPSPAFEVLEEVSKQGYNIVLPAIMLRSVYWYVHRSRDAKKLA